MRVAEIARRAGVSTSTVSRVLNKDPHVRPETVSQVHKILEQFPYDPYAIRRGPRPGKRTKKLKVARELEHAAIAIVVIGRPHEHWFKQPIFASIVSSITRAASDRQLSVQIDEVLDAGKIGDRIHGSVVDGALVFVASDARLDLLEAVRSRLPVVRVVGDDLVPLPIDQVRADNLAVGHLAYDYLAERGCRQMACVTSRPGHGGIYLRQMAFAAAAVREGNLRPSMFVTGDKPIGPTAGTESVHCADLDQVAAHLAERVSDTGPIGVFATQDIETIGLVPFLARHGLRPGHDVHLVSCNNDESLAMLSPRPATIDLDPAAIGKWALRRLLNRIARPDDRPIQILVKPRLVRPDQTEPI